MKQRERQKAIVGRALMGMVVNEDAALQHACLCMWREEVTNAKKGRAEEDMNVQLNAEMRRYRERHQAAVRSCIAKWGSELRGVATASTFAGWNEVVRGFLRLRAHAEKVFAVGWNSDVELVWRSLRSEDRFKKLTI